MIFRRDFFLPNSLFALFAATVICIFLATPGPATAQRLPDTVRPLHYSLTLTPDLKAATFSGVETIDVALADPTYVVTLNSAEIECLSVSRSEEHTSELQSPCNL